MEHCQRVSSPEKETLRWTTRRLQKEQISRATIRFLFVSLVKQSEVGKTRGPSLISDGNFPNLDGKAISALFRASHKA